jgi:hypothetical protein
LGLHCTGPAGNPPPSASTPHPIRSDGAPLRLPRDRSALLAPSLPVACAHGCLRLRFPRLLTGGRTLPELLGHTGSIGSWVLWSPHHDLCLAGTVNETGAAALPYRVAPMLLRRLVRSAS